MNVTTTSNVIASLDYYSIYKMNGKDNNVYYVCVPKQETQNYQLFIGFSDKDLNSLSKEQIVSEIANVNDVIQKRNSITVLAIPEIPVAELERAALENDDRKYNDILVQRIQPMTSEIYNMLIVATGNIKKMEPTISVIIRNDTDKKIAGWLSMRLGDHFIKEVDFDKLKVEHMNKDEEHKNEVLEKTNDETVLEYVSDELKSNEDITLAAVEKDAIAPINHQTDNGVTRRRLDNRLVRKLTKPGNMSGFSSIRFIIITLVTSLVVGIGFGILMMK